MKRKFALVASAMVALLIVGTVLAGILAVPSVQAARIGNADTGRAGLLAPSNNTYQSIPFSQNWSITTEITVNDDWSSVPGIIGYLGDYTTASPTGVDPQTLVSDTVGSAIDVIANQSTPNTNISGGVGEFDGIADPVVALQGSGTADAPHIILYLNTTSLQNISVSYNVRDIDGSADNAVQPVALHYRVGTTGSFTNLPDGYISDATTGPSLATLVTPVTVTLPVSADNQSQVQLRIMTTNAAGSDEWVGIDDISVTGTPIAIVPETDLGVSKSGPATALTSETITYTINLSNTGNYTATGTIVTDSLPAEVTFDSYTTTLPVANFTQIGQDLIWDLGDVPTTTVNATIDVQVSVSPTLANGASFTNTVEATSTYTETTLANNGDFAVTFVGAPDLAIVKTSPASVNAGETFTYTLAYSNAGTIDASGVVVVDQLPAGVTFVTETTASILPVNGRLTWTIGSLIAGNSSSIEVAVTADTAGDWANTATISGGPVDSDLTNNSSIVTTTINGVEVSVSKSGPAIAAGGSLISYTLTYGNAGNITATATLTDHLPISFTVGDIAFDGSGQPFVDGADSRVWSIEIAPNTEVSFTFALTVPATISNSTRITNSLSISALDAGDDPADNTAAASSTVYQFTSIHDIQYVDDPDISDTSAYSGTWVAVQGVVIANPGSFLSASGLPYRYYIEDPAGGPWSGLYIYRGTLNPPGVHEGDFVQLYGLLTEFVQGGSQQTELDLSRAGAVQQIVSTGNPLPAPAVLTTDQLINAGSAEQWESVLIEFQHARVTNPNIGNNEWNFDDGSGATIGDDNAKAGGNTVFTYVPQLNDHYAFIRGIGWQSFGTYKLEPRYNADVLLDYLVTFTYNDLEDVVHTGENVQLRGDFNGWSGVTMTHDAGYTVFSATVTLPTTATQNYKYYVPSLPGNSAWDMLNGSNRSFAPTQGVTVKNDYRHIAIGWANLQSPPTAQVNLGQATPDIYGQIYIPNVTDLDTGAGRGIVAQLGYGSTASPATWTWSAMTFITRTSNNSEFVGAITPSAGGVYSYAVRYDPNGGVGNPNASWTYADLDGIPFSLDQAGVLTVTAPQLAFAKSADKPASEMQPGDVVTYTLELSNSGDGVATGVLITDVLPVEVTFGGFVTASGAQYAGGAVTWSGSLNASVTATVVFTVTVGDRREFYGRTVTNTAQFTSSNGGSDAAEAVFQIVNRYFILLPLVQR